jgi:hypothetical protein
MFRIPDYKLTQITGADGLNNLRTVIASGVPIAFGTSLYADFPHYRGKRSPYVGNGQVSHHSNGTKAGRVMLIVAYDDAYTTTTERGSDSEQLEHRLGRKGIRVDGLRHSGKACTGKRDLCTRFRLRPLAAPYRIWLNGA